MKDQTKKPQAKYCVRCGITKSKGDNPPCYVGYGITYKRHDWWEGEIAEVSNHEMTKLQRLKLNSKVQVIRFRKNEGSRRFGKRSEKSGAATN
jgi:hypothetical protein